MGHDTHFLHRLSRLNDRRALELALGLYRDPRAVRLIVGHHSLPDDAERVALALDDSPRPPHVLVARNGRFVTCLGAGMGVSGCPVLSRAQVDQALEQSVMMGLADARIACRGSLDALLLAVVGGGRRVAREDFEAVNVVAPALQRLFAEVMDEAVEVQRLLVERYSRLRPEPYDPKFVTALEASGQAACMLDHLVLLSVPTAALAAATDAAATVADLGLVVQTGAELTTAARAATFAAQLGPRALETYVERWREATHLQTALGPFASLVALAARYPETRDAAFAALERPPPAAVELVSAAREARRGVDDADRVEAELRAAARRSLIHEGVADADDALADAVIGADNASLLKPSVWRRRLPAVALWAARREPAEYCAPAATLERLPERVLPARVPSGEVRGRLDDMLAYYEEQRALDAAARALTGRAPAEVKPGRNAACPCGSGRKFKRCCLRRPT